MLKNSPFAEYPPLDASGRVWAWEFLRRSPDYQKFWREKCEPYLKDVPAGGCGGQTQAFVDWPDLHHDDAIDRFAVDVPSSPDSKVPPLFSTMWTRYVRGDAREISPGVKALALNDAEAAFVIDLSRPLGEQLDSITRIAYRLQSERGGMKEPRERRDKYTLYIEILDAMAAGYKAGTIRDTLFADLIHHENPSPRQTAYSKARKAALAMRDGGYKKLIGGN